MEVLEVSLIRSVLLAVVAIPVLGFYLLSRRVRAGRISKAKAVGVFSASSLLPTLAFGGVFFALVGVEEFTGRALVSEGLGRSFLLVVGLGALVWLLSTVMFLVWMSFVKIDRDAAQAVRRSG